MTKARFIPIAASAAIALCACIAIQKFQLASPSTSSNALRLSPGHIAIPAIERALRPVYPYSVIPGGVYAAGELQAAIQKDPAVRKHYAEFDPNHLKFVKLGADSYRHVSFRVGNQIYWTRKQLRIPKGEVLFTDGIHYARTRCGNRLAEQVSLEQTAALEPPADVLSPPPFRIYDGGLSSKSLGRGVVEGEWLPAQDTLRVQNEPILFPNTIPNVVTGARPATASTSTAPGASLSPWMPQPALALSNGSPSNPNKTGSTPTVVTPPKVPIPIPEPDELPIVAAFLCATGWFTWRRQSEQALARHIK